MVLAVFLAVRPAQSVFFIGDQCRGTVMGDQRRIDRQAFGHMSGTRLAGRNEESVLRPLPHFVDVDLVEQPAAVLLAPIDYALDVAFDGFSVSFNATDGQPFRVT